MKPFAVVAGDGWADDDDGGIAARALSRSFVEETNVRDWIKQFLSPCRRPIFHVHTPTHTLLCPRECIIVHIYIFIVTSASANRPRAVASGFLMISKRVDLWRSTSGVINFESLLYSLMKIRGFYTNHSFRPAVVAATADIFHPARIAVVHSAGWNNNTYMILYTSCTYNDDYYTTAIIIYEEYRGCGNACANWWPAIRIILLFCTTIIIIDAYIIYARPESVRVPVTPPPPPPFRFVFSRIAYETTCAFLILLIVLGPCERKMCLSAGDILFW